MAEIQFQEVDVAEVEFRSRGPRGSKFDALVDALADLEVDGKGIAIPCDPNADKDNKKHPEKVRNNLAQVIRNRVYKAVAVKYGKETAESVKFRCRLAKDMDKVVINCVTRPPDDDGTDDDSEDDE